MTRHLTKPVHMLFLAVVTIAGALAPQVRAESAVYEKAIQSTCWVVVSIGGGKLSYGTGWLVDKERRQILTNDHVILGMKEATIYFPIVREGKVDTQSRSYAGAGITAKVLRVDGKRDLALLQLSTMPVDVQTMPLAEKSPEVGQKVHSIGNSPMAGKPLLEGALWHYREGNVSAVEFKVITLSNTGGKVEARTVVTNSGTRPGDSGGPLVDSEGRLVGVVSSGTPNTDVSNTIDVGEVRAFLKEARAVARKPASPLEGHWTMSFKVKGNENFFGLSVMGNGKVLLEGTKNWTGTYSYENGKMFWEVPGLNIAEDVSLAWDNNNRFRFTSDGIEFVCSRR